ncbi:hypothetical protein I3760_14G123700 [Carya illinoinensis]|nr:hypothetical protein I3760_14G123700 [Carya illinoinensis]
MSQAATRKASFLSLCHAPTVGLSHSPSVSHPLFPQYRRRRHQPPHGDQQPPQVAPQLPFYLTVPHFPPLFRTVTTWSLKRFLLFSLPVYLSSLCFAASRRAWLHTILHGSYCATLHNSDCRCHETQLHRRALTPQSFVSVFLSFSPLSLP